MRSHGRRRLFFAAAVVVPLLLLSGCATNVGYLWKQGRYLLRYSLGAKKISSILRNPETPADLKTFLQRVEQIKHFAVEKIGLSDDGNYTTYKKIDRDYLVNVVQAADALSFTPYQWNYPVLGKLPYRGYYDPADATAEAERLKRQGYDVIVRKVDAFSTLGFLKDPVYSFMRSYTLYELSSLIIHEQTHATVFLKGQDQFNEELATYVGDNGALQYLRTTYGPRSSQYVQGSEEKADSAVFVGFIRQLTHALSGVYNSSLSDSVKRERKAEVIARYRRIFASDYRPRFQTEAYRKMKLPPLNNAYLMLFNLYTGDIPVLARYNAEICGGNLKTFLTHIKLLAKHGGNPMEKIRRQLGAAANVGHQDAAVSP